MTSPHAATVTLGLLAQPTRFLFFTGKGGVGKTSLSTAAAIALADAGRQVLLVSTDAASNLDEMLGVPLSNQPVAVPGVPGLHMLNIDPDTAAESYRQRVLAQLEATASSDERATVREQLSGACTTEIAAFDEFAALLASEGSAIGHVFDHVVFDTAPTGHTLRLLSLPKAWTGFLAGNDRGGTVMASSQAKLPTAEWQTVWRDEDGIPLLRSATVGQGRMLQWQRRLDPHTMPLLLEPEFADGLQRARFLPFIALLQQHCHICNLDTGIDYRRQQPTDWRYLGINKTSDWLRQQAEQLYGAVEPCPQLQLHGRPIPALWCNDQVIAFDFMALCSGPRSQLDYMALCQPDQSRQDQSKQYRAIALVDVPQFLPESDTAILHGVEESYQREHSNVFVSKLDNEARRLIALVDDLVLTTLGRSPRRLAGAGGEAARME